jgi:DNA-directed RNA polymerase sigma subunit (sigma70/sigma32)
MPRAMADRGHRKDRKPTGDRSSGGRRDDEDAAVRALRSKLSGVLRRLPDIERQVVELRMGLAEGVPAKPGEVAERLGMSIAEVRKIEARAFSRIREVGPIKGLERFLER